MIRAITIIAFFIVSKGFAQTSILLTNASNSQSVTPNDVYTVSTAPTVTYATLFNVTNVSSNTQRYVTYRYEVASSTSGGASSFCYAGGCYGPPAYISDTQTLTPGQSASDITGSYQLLSVDYEEGNSSSYSLVKYTIKSIDTPGDSITFYMRYNQPTGINELKRSSYHFNVWPNPASEHVAIQLDSQKEINGEVSLINMLGQKVRSVKVNKASIISINVSDIPKGIYFISIRSKEGSETKRISVN